MKKLFAIFCLFITIGAHAGVPQWFLHPKQGEYVGVSLPDGDENMAIMSALLSYAVNNPPKDATVTTYKYPIRYTITREQSNIRKEIFVALQIEESKTDTLSCKIMTLSSQGVAKEDKPISWEQMMECTLVYNKEIFYMLTVKDRSEQAYPTIEHICKRGIEKSYAQTSDGTLLYSNQYLTPPGLGWHISCAQSLHYAYMRALASTLSKKMHVSYPMAIHDNKLIVNVHIPANNNH